MKKKTHNLLIFLVIGIIVICGLSCIHMKQKYDDQVQKAKTSCQESINNALDELVEYKNEGQERNLSSAVTNLYTFVVVYEFLPEESYNVELHKLMNQIQIKLGLEQELSTQEVDILIDGLTVLTEDIEDTEGYWILLKLFNE